MLAAACASRVVAGPLPAQDPGLDRARALFEEARAANAQAARAKAAEAVDALLSGDGVAESGARIDLLFDLGTFASAAGDWRVAQRAWRHVLEVRSRTLPEDHADVQKARGNLAIATATLGDLQGARSLFEEMLEIQTRTLPDDHRDLQKVRDNLASTMFWMGDLSGAKALQEKVLEISSRTLPDDHLDLQKTRLNLANTLFSLGDLSGARALQEKVLEISSRTLPDDHPDLQTVRANLAITIEKLGDLQGARSLFEKVLEVFSRTLPDDHPNLQAVRLNLAGTMYSLGDLQGARELFEQVRDVCARTLPDDHPVLQSARLNLADTMYALGDLQGARSLFEKVLEVSSRTLPDDHPDLQKARNNLAIALWSLGDLHGARALEEKMIEVQSRTLPDDHPDLQKTRLNLANSMFALGDLSGARALQEQVLEVDSRTLPDDHPDLQNARLNLAITVYTLGDLQVARELQERVLEVRSRTLPDDHPDLQTVRHNLARTLGMLGDVSGARALQEKVLEVSSRTLPDDHPDFQKARLSLASTMDSLDELSGARALQEKVLEVFSRTLPDDHPDLQAARLSLASTIAAWATRAPGEEEESAFTDLARAYTGGLAGAARVTLLTAGSREAEERCANLMTDVGKALSFASGVGVFPSDAALERDAFALSETTRGAALVSTRLARLAHGDERYVELRGEVRAASEEIARLVQRGGESDDLDDALARRGAAERELLSRAAKLSGGGVDAVEFDPDALVAALSDDAAILAYRRYERWKPAEGSSAETSTDSLCAFVVRPGRDLARVELGPIDPIAQAVDAWREALGSAAGRGSGVRAVPETQADLDGAGDRLRSSIFDPLLPALGDARRIVLVLDDVLHVVPFEALTAPVSSAGAASPKAAGELLGDRYRFELHTTLRELLWKEADSTGSDLLVALGGAGYSAEPGTYGGAELATPVLASADRVAPAIATEAGSPVALGTSTLLRGGAWEAGFASLPGTRDEARGIAELHGEVFGDGAPTLVLEGSKASRVSIEELAPRARWLHLATHGWFAPDSIRSWEDLGPLDEVAGLRTSAEERVKGASPMVLCGLALAGANLPADAIGRYPGLVTAEEISSWDLSSCELAVLSACDTNVGERRAGQGVASLQKALHMAGARTVITSLWKVPDEATKELMLDFYRRIWVENTPKAEALWEAKMKLRDARDASGRPEHTTRDWAAWVLTGEPR